MRTLALVLLLALIVVALTPASSDAVGWQFWWMDEVRGPGYPDGPNWCTCPLCTGFARMVGFVAQLGVML